MTDTQPEALRLAALFERYALDHAPDGWPAIQQRELTAAAAELRQLLAWAQELEGRVFAECVGTDLVRLTERGAVAWAGVDAQALREGRMPHNAPSSPAAQQSGAKKG